MPSREEYRAKAHECLQRASTETDKETAALFRMLATDYLALAESEATPVAQQQQQIQPKSDDPDENT